MKALASGDPRILEKARADSETTRLERLHRSWSRNQQILDTTLAIADRKLPGYHAERDQLDQALAQVLDTRGDAFTATIDGRRHTSRADAAGALGAALTALDPTHGDRPPRIIGHLAGFDLLATAHRLLEPHFTIELAGAPRTGITVSHDEARAERPLGLITRLENRAAGIPKLHADVDDDITRLTAERARAAAELGQPFPHTDALHAARHRSLELAAELAEEAARHQHTDSTAADPDPASSSSDQAVPSSTERYLPLVDALPDGGQITSDPSWPRLAAALDRAGDVHGNQVIAEHLEVLAATSPLDAHRPALDLLTRLTDAYPMLATPLPVEGYATLSSPPTTAPAHQPPHASPPPPGRQAVYP